MSPSEDFSFGQMIILPAAGEVYAALCRIVGHKRAPLLAATLYSDLVEAAERLKSPRHDVFRRGCHALVALADLAGSPDLTDLARRLLDRTQSDADWPASGLGRHHLARLTEYLAACLQPDNDAPQAP